MCRGKGGICVSTIKEQRKNGDNMKGAVLFEYRYPVSDEDSFRMKKSVERKMTLPSEGGRPKEGARPGEGRAPCIW